MMVIGFTGTRGSMTIAQRDTLKSRIKQLALRHPVIRCVHGGAVGADRQFDRLCKEFGFARECYPSNEEQRQWALQHCTVIHAVSPPLTRNRIIVEVSGQMFATPLTFIEERRSGTWATIRYAKKTENTLTVIWPDGSVTCYHEIEP